MEQEWNGSGTKILPDLLPYNFVIVLPKGFCRKFCRGYFVPFLPKVLPGGFAAGSAPGFFALFLPKVLPRGFAAGSAGGKCFHFLPRNLPGGLARGSCQGYWPRKTRTSQDVRKGVLTLPRPQQFIFHYFDYIWDICIISSTDLQDQYQSKRKRQSSL